MNEAPGHHNKIKNYIVLLDVLPDIGELDGFFSFVYNRRTINGRLFHTAQDALIFIKTLADSIKVKTNTLYGVAPAQLRVVLMSRLDEGYVMSANSLRDVATEAYIHAITRKINQGRSIENRETIARQAAAAANRLVNSIPTSMRAHPTLLRGEDPIKAMNASGYYWRVIPDTNALYQSYLSTVYREYTEDTTVPITLRQNVWQVSRYISLSVDRVLPRVKAAMIDEFAQRKNNSAALPWMMTSFLTRMERALANYLVTYNETMLSLVLRNRVEYTNDLQLDDFIFATIRASVNYDTMRDSLLYDTPVPGGVSINGAFNPGSVGTNIVPRVTSLEYMRGVAPSGAWRDGGLQKTAI